MIIATNQMERGSYNIKMWCYCNHNMLYNLLLSFMNSLYIFILILQDEQKNHLRMYWKHLSGVAIGCISLFIFDLCERGIQLRNPFYSIWVTDLGTHLAVSFQTLPFDELVQYFSIVAFLNRTRNDVHLFSFEKIK